MNQKIKFSIGIPAFKAQYLSECIDSILCQSYSNFELIIVNDASPYNVDEVVSSYKDQRIRYYVNEKNIGAENVVENWNRTLSYATGEYFLLMGDDDKLSPNYLSRFFNMIEKYHDVNVLHCRTAVTDQDSNILFLSEGRPEWESMCDSIYQRLRGNRIQFISDFIYKTNYLKQNAGFMKFPLAWNSDDVTAFDAADGSGIVHVNEVLFYYRSNPFNISSTGNWMLKIKAIQQKENWILKKLNSLCNTSEEDKVLVELIRKDLSLYIQKNIIRELSDAVRRRNVCDLFMILKKHKNYQLTYLDAFRLVYNCFAK